MRSAATISIRHQVSKLPLSGTLRAGVVQGPNTVRLLIEPEDTGAGSLVTLSRGRQPAILSPFAVLYPAPSAPRGRSFRALARGPGSPRYTQMFVVRGVLYVVAFHDGALRLWALPRPANATLGPPITHSAAALGLDEVRSSAVWSPDAAPRGFGTGALLMGGVRQGHWHVAAVALPPSRGVYPLGDAVAPQLPLCHPAGPCVAVAGLAVHGQGLWMALERVAQDVLMVAVDLWALTPAPNATSGPGRHPASALERARVRRSAPVQGTMGGRVTEALLVDAPTGAVYVAVRVPRVPSSLYRLHAATLVPYGTVRLGARGGPPEQVRTLVPDPAARRLYALTDVARQPVVAAFLTVAVTAVSPGFADEAGGTVLTVKGEGFVPGVTCLFGGRPARATVQGPDVVLCEAPPTSGAARCATEALEVGLGPRRLATENRVGLLRVSTPAVTAVVPDRGYHNASQVVHVSGYGFMPSPFATCRFAAKGVAVEAAGPGAVTVLSATRLLCRQPVHEGPLPVPSYLEVSMDGQVPPSPPWAPDQSLARDGHGRGHRNEQVRVTHTGGGGGGGRRDGEGVCGAAM